MTHWGWDNTDEEYSTETDSDCEYIYVSSSSSESEIKDNHAICEKEKVPVSDQSVSPVNPEVQTLQRTYSNLSGICGTTTTQSGVEVCRCISDQCNPCTGRGQSSTFDSSCSRKFGKSAYWTPNNH